MLSIYLASVLLVSIVDTPEDPASPPSRTRSYTSATVRLVSESYIKGIRLTSAGNTIFGVYQDWVHQNPGTHLDGGIDEDGK